MAKHTFFVTGTDTDAGKTAVTVALLDAAKRAGLKTLGLKPVAAGAESNVDGALVNDDALALQQAMTLPLPYEQVNPAVYAEPASPHIAAALEQRRISVRQLDGICRGAMLQSYDVGFVEGAGGWRVPLNERELLSDLAIALNLPVVLVVGLKLGCLNHALLTAAAIRADGLSIAGWVGCSVQPEMAHYEANIDTLTARLGEQFDAPCWGVVPHLSDLDQAADFIKTDWLCKD